VFALQGHAAVVEGALKALGLELPAVANTVTHFETLDVFWVGRTRWLVRGPLDAEDELGCRLRPLSKARGTDAVCVSDYYAGFALEGPDTRAVLAQACPLDVHECVFATDAASFTSLFSLSGLLHFESNPDTYGLYVEASFADYVQRCFESVIG
jgi:heterotetrameric sarcosine oxidase gamma subunit